MANPQANLARMQEIANRGIQDQLDPRRKGIFDEAVKRGLVTIDPLNQQQGTEQIPALSGEPQMQEPDLAEQAKGFYDKANDAIRPAFETGAGAVAAEFMSAVNRGAIDIAEFFTTDQINAVMEIAGSDKRVPGIGDSGFAQGGTQGGYMDEGLARNIVAGAGEVVPAALGSGALLRQAASRLPMASQGESLGRGLLRQTRSSTVAQDAVLGATAGAGSVAGGEAGEVVGGERGRTIGEAVGSFAAPFTAVAVTKAPGLMVGKSAKKALAESAPPVEKLKEASREIYSQIDELGAVIKPERVTDIVNRLDNAVQSQGFNRRIHPKVGAALKEWETVRDSSQPLSKLDTLRRVAQSAAASTEPDEARLGTLMLREIDGALDSLKPADFVGQRNAQVGKMYRGARELWSRARKSERLSEAFEKAENQASGFENGLRTQFRSILNSKRHSRGFTEEELGAMRRVVRGGTAENITKAIGKFGFSEDQAVRMLMPSLGVAGGAAVGGPVGAVAVPVIRQVSRSLSQRLTRNNAALADQIVRAGRNGRRIASAYVQTVPKSERSVEDLTELLMRPDVDVLDLLKMKPTSEAQRIIADAAYFASVLQKQIDDEDQEQDDPPGGGDATVVPMAAIQ